MSNFSIRGHWCARILTAAALVAVFSFSAGLGLYAQGSNANIRTGMYRGRPIQFKVINGWAVVEGDIIIGRPEELHSAAPVSSRLRPETISLTPTPAGLWPKVGNMYQVPYTNDNGNAVADKAVALFNTTMQGVIQYVKRTNEPDYVQFTLTSDGSSGCSSQSNVGRIGGPQQISGTTGIDCPTVIMHEMGHAVGLYHEQSRTDRDNYVQIQWGNIDPNNLSQYYGSAGSLNIGLYDLGSAMHYNIDTFPLDGTDVTMSSLPVGIPFKEGGGYSAGDIDGIRRLYNAAPVPVTITTNPPGLQVTVDDQIVTTGTPGATFNWALGSNHVLDVPANLQTQKLSGTTYTFGRWNDILNALGQTARHTITVAPGDGTYFYPVTSPFYTTYSANFQVLVPAAGAIATSVSPAAGGTVTLSPDPVNIQGTTYYFAYQPVSVTAVPAAGFNFYDWQFDRKSPVFSGANPRVVRPSLTQGVMARFVQNPVTSIVTAPAGLPVTVDGTQYNAPKNFAQDFDASWAPGSSHSVAVTSPLPSNVADPKARLVFANWSDGGAQTHNVTAGPNAALTANFNLQFQLNTSQLGVQQNNAASNCAAGFIANPASADGYYNIGTPVSVSVQPNPGWTFLGWQGDVAGNANPAMLTMDATKNIQAAFNTINAPLTITSLLPATGTLNSPTPITVAINGTGFTANTQVCFLPPNNGAGPCLPITYQTPNLIQVQVSQQDVLAAAQTWTVSATNSPDMQCSVSASGSFPVK